MSWLNEETDELSKYYTRAMGYAGYEDLTEKQSIAMERLRTLDWFVQCLKKGEV